MFYQAEFDFLQHVLSNMHLHYSMILAGSAIDWGTDLHLRELLGLTQDYEMLTTFARQHMKSNTIYHFTDPFLCHYSCLRLPDTEEDTIFLIGPYVTELLSKPDLMQLIEHNALPPQVFPFCEKYFYNVPYLADHNSLTVILNTFASKIWGGMENFSVEFVSNTMTDTSSVRTHENLSEQENTLFEMQALEHRYAIENEFMQAVSQGLSHKARMLIANSIPAHTQTRALDSISNTKYYLIVLNTLLRKAAEQGSVHPLHIDQLSTDFAYKIDRCNSIESANKLLQEMIHKYCLLVKNHSMKGYSLLVQKVITRIDSDLTADLSLNAVAALLNINASYLSNLFKKETGSTLTEYVNRRRIEHGILLLNSTTLQVQTIAQYCGIPDVNYFTKLFKRYIGKTPKDYRESVHHPGR
ncbi:MAG: helix-turn-helix transcriptional regulator [Lachnospiraceae bacterium]|nr:helix-turn-helix transcriptional regulator [Lachnospiraceae bacterium]